MQSGIPYLLCCMHFHNSQKVFMKQHICCKKVHLSVIKQDEVMPFAATWIGLEMIIESVIIRQRQIYDITYMWNLEKMIQMNLFGKQRHSQTQKTNFWLPFRIEEYRGTCWESWEFGINIYLCVCILSCVHLFLTPWTVAFQAPLSTGFSRQEYWSGLPFLIPEDPPDQGSEPTSLVSPALASEFFYHCTTWEAPTYTHYGM